MSQRTPTDDEATILASEYIQHGDQTRAFRVAFPDSQATDESQQQRASKAFDTVKVRSRIEQLQAISKKNSEEEFELTVAELKGYLKTIIEKGIADGETVDNDGNKTIKVGNLSAAVSAIKEVNAMDGNHSPLKTQEINANELTPWSSVKASVDKLDE